MILNQDPTRAFTGPPWYTQGPVAGIGDSISVGHPDPPGFTGVLEGGPSGDATWQPLYQLDAQYPAAFTFYTGAIGSTGAANLGGELDFVLALSPLPVAVIVHTGINDLAGGAVFGDISSYFDTARGRIVGAGAVPFWDELLPWTGGNDTQAAAVRTWNTALASWCSTNSVTLIQCHDPMGQNRVSTGHLDDMKSSYAQDNIHPNKAGYTALGGTIWKAAMASYFGS